MPKRYDTPHRTRTIKTRMTEEEYADFLERLTTYGMSRSEFIRQAIRGVTVNPITHCPARSAARSPTSPPSSSRSFGK